ncbi:MAG TPA: adenylate/guanylate cyclase domain-containing protein [Acidimicrobiia bacterium]|nr:adenylate/guanylate cyclase domain-containing protein [Acidimicrobiia bacterium]
MVDTVAAAHDALRKHAWAEAFEAFVQVDRQQGIELGPEDLEAMAEAAWWSARPDEAEGALQRAFAGHSRTGNREAAAVVAVRLAVRAFERGSLPVAHGWLSQAERALEGAEESGAHAWVELIRTGVSLVPANDPDATVEHADRAIELARVHGEPDVEALATSFKGAALLRRGDVEQGLALIDEATALASSGAIRPKVACDVYCVTISTCRTLADYRRAGEWIDVAERWMKRESIPGYTGVCRVHRAELKRLGGAWAEAEQEARDACVELEHYRLLSDVGYAHAEVGEVRRHRGDLQGADEAYARAYQFGWSPQPGLALLHLARGEVDEAARSIARALEAVDTVEDGRRVTNPLERAMLLPAVVEIALAVGDPEGAGAAADELEAIAARHPGLARDAQVLTARGRVRLADGDHRGAIDVLERGWRLWQELSVPYESARARLLLGRARHAIGDEPGARLEWMAARSVFARLGAVPDLVVVDELLGEELHERDRVVRTFLFTDIVTSTDLIGLIGDEAWEELLRWHDRTLRAAFATHGGDVVRHTGDGFFVAFADPTTAIRCAIEIQRQLADHRHHHGFAPWVRIGMHTAEATRQGADFSGQGVHIAARVADLGEREEVVITADTLAAAPGFETSEARQATLKGIPDPIEVYTVRWR